MPRLLAIFLLLMAVNAHAEVQTIPLPVTLNQREVEGLNARIENNQLVSLDIRPIKDALQQILAPEQYKKLETNTAAYFTLPELEAAGVQTHFDYQSLAVQMSVAPDKRRGETLNLVGNPNLTANRTVLPSTFSAYMNLRGGVDYVETSPGALTGFTTPRLALENAFNVRGLVLENETDINPAPNKTWEKRDTRLIWDQPENRLRWTLGDLNYPVTGFQNFLSMAGLSLHREDRLQPYHITSPLGQAGFLLKQDSRVEVLVNGRTVQTLQMAAGPHRINNFPLTGGANNVVLRITDPVGRVENINTTLFYDPGLLKKGESEFNYAVGFPSITQAESAFYRYNPNPAGSVFHRWGLSDWVTAGVNAQGTQDTQQGGAQGILAAAAGIFSYDTAISHDITAGVGHSQRLQYNYYGASGRFFANGNVNLSVQYQSSRFTTPNPFFGSAIHNSAWDFGARYTQRINERWSAGLGYARVLEEGRRAGEDYSLTLSHHWGRVSASATVQRQEGGNRPRGWGSFLSVIINLDHGHSANATYDTTTHTTRAEWQYVPPANYGTLSSTLGMQNNHGQNDIHGNVRYLGQRAELDLNQDTQLDGESRTGLRWGTALVYADGTFGISQPIQDSFAIINSTGSLRAEGGLGVQRQGNHFTGKEDWLGPAVLPELTSYHNRRLEIEPRRAEADFDPQQNDVLLKPTYRSGTHVEAGQTASANVTATLIWPDRTPASLQSGTLTAADGSTTEFISNREGLMFIHGLPSGTYAGTFLGRPEATFRLMIPSNKQIGVDLGQIQVKE